MIGWNKAAGILTLFGLAGLFLSPFILNPAVSAPAYGDRKVAIAIAAGPQLRLLSTKQPPATPQNADAVTPDSAMAMLCGRVFRLAFADVGFSCKAGDSIAPTASSKPALALAGN